MNTPLYRAMACRVHPVDGNLAVLTSDRWPSGRPVAALAASALTQCLAERTLEDHQRVVAASLRQSDPEAESTIGTLVALGLLLPVEAPAIRMTEAIDAPASIGAVGVVTADRPATLRRCLTSYCDHLRHRRRFPRVIVVDGSRGRESQAETERVVSELTSKELGITYVGSQFRRDIRARAVAHGLSESAVAWLLPDPGPQHAAGGNRNLLLLLTAGMPLLTVDDDTVCRPWRTSEDTEGMAFSGHVEHRQTRPFERREDVLESLRPVDVDLLAAHEALLGHSLADLADASDRSRDLNDVCAHILPGVDGSRPEWRVRATWSGIAGDGAVACPYPLLFSRGAARELLSASDGALRTALTSREVIRGVPTNTVSDEPSFMTYCAAIDNAGLVPPFLPVGMNEDGLFGGMLRMCDTSAFIAQIPYGIVHDSGRPAAFPDRHMPSATSVRMSDVIAWLAEPGMRQDLRVDVSVRMRALGDILIAAGSLPSGLFRSLLADRLVEAKCRTLRAAEVALGSGFDYPAHWRQSMRRYQQAVLTSLTSERLCVPVEYEHCSLDEALANVQRDLCGFGHALQVWPELWMLGMGVMPWT